MIPGQQLLDLIGGVYEAALDPPRWQHFVDDLSSALDGAAIIMALQVPGSRHPGVVFRKGFVADDVADIARFIEAGRWPWLPHSFYAGRFRSGDEQFPNDRLGEHPVYREWMMPRGLAPDGPLQHVISANGEYTESAISVFRKSASRAITEEDVRSLDVLVSHLGRAYQMNARARERRAIDEVIERLSVGVILLDRLRRPVLTNRSADRIVALRDGLSLDQRGLRASDARTDGLLQSMIAHVIEHGTVPHDPPHSVLSAPRPSGARDFPLYVSPVLMPMGEGTLLDAAVTVLALDPDVGDLPSESTLQRLFDLGRAEAAVLRLLAEGHTLESAAERRGVSLHTIRSQLKSVFAKTQTSRQSDLLRVVLLTGRDWPEG